MNTLSIFSDIQSSFGNIFEYENGGEIPRRSVDQGLSTSPKSTTVDLLYDNYKRIMQECQLPPFGCFWLFMLEYERKMCYNENID